MDDMFDNEEDGEMRGPHVKHKDGLRMRRLDADDRAKIKEELTQHTHPFEVAATSLMNIMNGHIGGSDVNVQDAAELGTDILRSLYNDMPSGFYVSIRKRVTMMETAKKEEEEEERFISNNNYIFTQIIYIRIVYTIGRRGKQKVLTYI